MIPIGIICFALSGVVAWKTRCLTGWFLGTVGTLIFAVAMLIVAKGGG